MRNTLGTTLIAGAALLALGAAPAAAQNGHQNGHQNGEKNLVETAVEAGTFSTLATALEAAGLIETLSSGGPFTVFAPTDAAFAKLPEGTLESLLADPEKLRAVLTYHVVPGRVTSSQVVNLQSAETVNGQEVRIRVVDGKVMIDGATVTTADIGASNGVIHVIDEVILPGM